MTPSEIQRLWAARKARIIGRNKPTVFCERGRWYRMSPGPTWGRWHVLPLRLTHPATDAKLRSGATHS